MMQDGLRYGGRRETGRVKEESIVRGPSLYINTQ